MALALRIARLLHRLLPVAVSSLAACGGEVAPGKAIRGGTPGVHFLEVRAIGGAAGPVRSRGLDSPSSSDRVSLPDPAQGPRLVRIGDEWRSARGVSTTRPLAAALRAAPGRALRFSYGVPAELVRPGGEVSLRVRLEGREGGMLEATYPLSLPEERIRWRQAGLPLAVLGEQEVEVRWDVLGAGEGEDAVCAVGEVSLVQLRERGQVVLLITSDTHRGDHLGAARDGVVVSTPAIDAQAESGILFEDCSSPSNLTNPSHVAIMTGTHPRDTGIVTNYTRLAGDAPTLAEAFRSAGYVTYGAVSTRHLIDSVSGLGQGFERFVGPTQGYSRKGRGTLSFVRRWVRESPGLPIFI